MSDLSYKSAGVDLQQYQESMKRLPKLLARTQTPGAMPWNGGFAGLFQLNPDGSAQAPLRDPVMVSGTDGVGTKLKVAITIGRHDTVGIDLVAMCVNDVICAGARPLFFLDYVAMGRDDSDLLEQIVTGISEGCVQSGSALMGGETAIMPDIYQAGDYDLAGFSVGVVERDAIIDGSKIAAGDAIIGIGSNGFHSNGYSLIRKTVFEHAGLSVDDAVSETGMTVGETLLKPTKIYADVIGKVVNSELRSSVHGLAHITGGGLEENIERIMPDNVDAAIDCQSWTRPPEFAWLQRLGDIAESEMYKVFNQGIGFAIFVKSSAADGILKLLAESDVPHCTIGEIRSGKGKVNLEND